MSIRHLGRTNQPARSRCQSTSREDTRNYQRPLARRGAFDGEGLSAKQDRRYGGETRWTSASKPSRPTFSRSPGKTWTRSARVCASPSPCEAIFRLQEPKKRMKGQAAHACRALCRARVAEELQRRLVSVKRARCRSAFCLTARVAVRGRLFTERSRPPSQADRDRTRSAQSARARAGSLP